MDNPWLVTILGEQELLAPREVDDSGKVIVWDILDGGGSYIADEDLPERPTRAAVVAAHDLRAYLERGSRVNLWGPAVDRLKAALPSDGVYEVS